MDLSSHEIDPAPPFRSILFAEPIVVAADPGSVVSDCFPDLHLDEVVGAITAGREAYDLAGFFATPLTSVATIGYRHEVFRDLEDPVVMRAVESFAQRMHLTRECLEQAAKGRYRYEQERWFLESVETYRAAVAGLSVDLAEARPRSRGLRAFGAYLGAYQASAAFAELARDSEAVRAGLDGITYRLHIQAGRVRVSRYDDEPDYGTDVLRTFERFKQGAVDAYRFKSSLGAEMNHVEAAIVDRVALLYPAVFASLDAYRAAHYDYLDPAVARFDREVQFYVAYLGLIGTLRRTGLSFCYPNVSDRSKAIRVRAAFDIALAQRGPDRGPIVPNEVRLDGSERILVISGPNQGGKTTYARMVGQIHHLARIGCLVPGSQARLPLVDRIFTHFERAEDIRDQSGKLGDDLRRIHRILGQASSASLLVMNESFGSTTLQDALFLSKEIMGAIIACDLLCVTVTFLDELATLGPTTVSMVSTIDPDDPARRTFEIVRRPADGLAYAMAIARKHGLTYEDVTARLAR